MVLITESCSDKEKGDQVTITIADEEEQAPIVSPQLMSYLWLLYCMSLTFSLLLGATPGIIIYGEKSPLKDDLGWFLLITTIVAVCLTIISSAISVFANCYMRSCMRTSHYTVLKTVGSLSGILAHFSLGCFLIFPHITLNWIAYSVIGVIFVGIAVGYWFIIWKHAICHQQTTEFNDDASFPWSLYVIHLLPLQLAAFPFLPVLFKKLFNPVLCFEVLVYILTLYLLSKRKNVSKLEPSDRDSARQRGNVISYPRVPSYLQNLGLV